jgi:phosphatidylglycerophosphatase C
MTLDTPLAVFDLDGTLVRGDSFLPFLLSYALGHRRYLALPAFPLYGGLYVCKILSDRTAKERLIRAVCRAQPLPALAAHAERFYDTWVQTHLRPSAIERLRFHQAEGHRVILQSASPNLYVPAIARHLNIAEVICTEVATKDGRCTGRLQGENCKGDAKVRLLQAYLGLERPPPGSFAYGDQRHDLFLLRWVRRGYLLNKRTGVFDLVTQPADP